MIELINEESTAGDLSTAIKLDVITEETSIIEIVAVGPQGPQGIANTTGGTVTSFSAGDCAPLFTTTEATPTTTPALSFALTNATAHSYLGNNTGSNAAPDYHQIAYSELTGTPTVPADISGAHYVTTQAESGLSAESNLGALTTGLLKHTVAAGVSTPATATAGTDYADNAFKTVAVSGQSNVVADSAADTLTLAAGSNITISTDASTDTVTIASGGSASGAITNAASPNSTIPINVLVGAPANILTKSITYAVGDQVTMKIRGAIFNNSGAGRQIRYIFNLGTLTATIDLGLSNIGASATMRYNFYIEATFAVASTSSAWLNAYCIGSNGSNLGVSILISTTALSYTVNQHSASNLTGAQTTSIQAYSDNATAPQNFELASWTIEKVASNP